VQFYVSSCTGTVKASGVASNALPQRGDPAGACANVQDVDTHAKSGGLPESVEILIGQGSAMAAIVNTHVGREVDALGHSFARLASQCQAVAVVLRCLSRPRDPPITPMTTPIMDAATILRGAALM
jgi:hypothetical protein